MRKFDHALCVTEQDTMLLKWLSGTDEVSYFPRGVDVPTNIPLYSSRERQSVVFVGTYSHQPNTDAVFWLAQDIFPLVLQKFPDAILYIIGRNPPRALLSLAAAKPQIKVLGFVDDVTTYLRRCSVFAAPLRFGGGVKIKILHAMAHGIPVVTTKIGAEGIEGMQSETVVVGDTTQRLADSISSLFADIERAERVGSYGYDTVSKLYSWDGIVIRLGRIYDGVVRD